MLSKQRVNIIMNADRAAAAPSQSPTADYDVFIPYDDIQQPLTDLPPEVYDLLFQETELMHELGHVMYTDYDAMIEAIESVERHWQGPFKHIFNAAEDGRIETQLAREYNVADDITVKSANLVEQANEMRAGTNGVIEYTVLEAITVGLLDMGYYDSGRFAAILDDSNHEHRVNSEHGRQLLADIKPRMADFMVEMLAEQDGRRAVQHTKRFFEDIRDDLEKMAMQIDVPEPRTMNASSDMDSNDPADADSLPDPTSAAAHVTSTSAASDDEQDDNGSDGGDGDGMGDDTTDAKGGESSGDSGDSDADIPDGQGAPVRNDDTDADGSENVHGAESGPDVNDLPDADGFEEDHDIGGESGDDDAAPCSSSDGGDGQSAGGAESGGSDVDADSDDDSVGASEGDLDEIEQDLVQKYEDEVRSDSNSARNDDPQMTEAETFRKIMQSGDGSFGGLEIVEPGSRHQDCDVGRMQEAQREGKQLATILQQQLQRERQTRDRPGRKSGRLDTQGLYRAAVGENRVFTRRERPGEKDYSCTVILDRSASMDSYENGQHLMERAEVAAGSLYFALEELGVNTSLMSLYQGMANLEVPFNADIDHHTRSAFTGVCVMGTPLSQTLELAKERLEQEDGHKFVIVVTDGIPDDEDRYANVLEETHMPVLGVYISDSQHDMTGEHYELFDRIVYAQISDVTEKVKQLAREVMF